MYIYVILYCLNGLGFADFNVNDGDDDDNYGVSKLPHTTPHNKRTGYRFCFIQQNL